jgi:hypothetical protein
MNAVVTGVYTLSQAEPVSLQPRAGEWIALGALILQGVVIYLVFRIVFGLLGYRDCPNCGKTGKRRIHRQQLSQRVIENRGGGQIISQDVLSNETVNECTTCGYVESSEQWDPTHYKARAYADALRPRFRNFLAAIIGTTLFIAGQVLWIIIPMRYWQAGTNNSPIVVILVMGSLLNLGVLGVALEAVPWWVRLLNSGNWIFFERSYKKFQQELGPKFVRVEPPAPKTKGTSAK